MNLGIPRIPEYISNIVLIIGAAVLLIYGRPENEKGGKVKYIPYKHAFVFTFFAQLLLLSTFATLYFVFKDDLGTYGGYIILTAYLVVIIAGIFFHWPHRDKANSLIYVFKHFSKEAWLIVLGGGILIFLLYTFAQCQAFGLPWSLDCVIKTIGK